MTISFRKTILVIGLLLARVISACAAKTSATQTPDSHSLEFSSLTMPSTEVRQLKSSATGRDYDIYVRLPDEYAQN